MLAAASPVVLTPVEGPSNFHRLGILFGSSGMGQTGAWGPPPELYVGPPEDFTISVPPHLVLSGADIYRVSCWECHKSNGNGQPPEIPPVYGPIQAMSATFMQKRMAERGRPITAAFARELATGSQKDFMNRIHTGGQKMPSFNYLNEHEISALITYLNVLASVPGSGKVATVTEPSERLGELLVKGTCHICHDAAGTWPTPEEFLGGAIPPIAGFTSKKTLPDFIWKVRYGAPVRMGPLGILYRGKMPVFDYLKNQDAGAAYLYLMAHPPRNASGLRKPVG